MPDWCLSSALAFPSDLGARRPCRGLRGWGCAHCQSLPRGGLFPRERKRPRLHVPFMLLLQVCLLQHEGLHFKECLLFQLKQQILKCRSLSFLENNQQFVNICNMPEQHLGWNSKNRLGSLFAKPCDKIQIQKRKIASVFSGLPHLFFLDGRKQTLRPDDCRI